jgi:hypothetical protein
VSQPQPYSPVHSFVSDASTLANFPGQSLDIEFQGVKTTTDQIRANLKLIQRDDGALANASVGFDQLSPALQTNGLMAAQAWVTGTTYPVGVSVLQSNKLYRCLVVHTSGVFATDLAAGDWQFITGLGLIGPTSSTAGNLPKFHDANGVILDDSGVALASLALLASPTLTGTPTAPTAAPSTNTTQIATTAYADAIAALKANLASPTFTGTPAAPTAAVDTNTTQLATTAFVLAQAAAANPLMDGSVAVGTSTRFARADHVHPVDMSRQALLTAGQLPGEPGTGSATAGNVGEYSDPGSGPCRFRHRPHHRHEYQYRTVDEFARRRLGHLCGRRFYRWRNDHGFFSGCQHIYDIRDDRHHTGTSEQHLLRQCNHIQFHNRRTSDRPDSNQFSRPDDGVLGWSLEFCDEHLQWFWHDPR